MTRVSLVTRYKIVESFEKTHSISATARHCEVSRKAVSLWVHRALQGVDDFEKKPIVRPALMSWEASKLPVIS
jgi:transposase-like protein